MIFTGPLVDALAVLVGGAAGTLIGDKISDRLNDIMMQALGLASIFIGISGALVGENIMVCILSLVIGGMLGHWCDLDGRMNKLSEFMERKLKKISFFRKSGKFTEGFILATVLSCTGGMAIVGSLESGISMNHDIMFSKSVMDLCMGVILASTLSVGVIFASVPLLLYQGTLTLIAAFIGDFLSDATVNEMSCVGSILIMAMGLNVVKATDIKVANLLPAPFLPIILCMFM